jgi:hypothetical protein
MIALFPLFGLGLSHVTYQQAYLGVGVGLLLGAVGIGALVWSLLRWRARRDDDTIAAQR